MKIVGQLLILYVKINLTLRKALINALDLDLCRLEIWYCFGIAKMRNQENIRNLIVWLGPYIIRDIAGPNSFYLSRLDGEPLDLPVNGKMLKMFFRDDI